MIINSFVLFLCIFTITHSFAKEDLKLIVITVASHPSDGFLRFNRSVHINNLNLEVLGFNEPWLGGDVEKGPGGGHKVNLLKKALEKYADNDKLIILFVDSFDVIIDAVEEEIINRFLKFDAKIVFSAEDFCWPNTSLEKIYPPVERDEHRFLNSGGFIGYSSHLHQMINFDHINNEDDDQLFYTRIFLDPKLRNKWNIKLDKKAQLFQNLNGVASDIEIRFNNDGFAYVHNKAFNTDPVIIHGNGPSKIALNQLGNYIGKAWSLKNGCLTCQENRIDLSGIKVENAPFILFGLFITHPTPFIDDFFANIISLHYPKKRISIIIFNNAQYHEKHVKQFIKDNSNRYSLVIELETDKEWQAKSMAMEECIKLKCDYYFFIESDARLTNPQTLINLIKNNRKVITPLLVRPNKLWSNFWGALSADGYYVRSHDYIDIVKGNRIGIWNVPHITTCYLIHSSVIHNGFNSIPAYPSFDNDPELSFSSSLRPHIFLYVDNTENYGHLIDPTLFDTKHVNSDFYEIYKNQLDWEKRYIHENWTKVVNEDGFIEQPCPDVYWFPVVTERFCKDLIEIMESHGGWSDGTNKDPRLAGGYENVPTRDIHMNQVDLEFQWLFFLREYIKPVQEKIFTGYFHDPPKAIMNFVVRYHPEEQAYLRPHHDSSTYTINIALNRPNIDYEGGGCRFVRYNCSVTNLRLGWSLIHPGRLTHYHEGLPVTKGTRYIMVSFVDP